MTGIGDQVGPESVIRLGRNTQLSTNGVERGLRTPVLGRKNHYGSKSERGTEVSAGMYSLIGSAKLVGLNPLVYLARTVAALLSGEAGLLPHEFVAAERAKS